MSSPVRSNRQFRRAFPALALLCALLFAPLAQAFHEHDASLSHSDCAVCTLVQLDTAAVPEAATFAAASSAPASVQPGRFGLPRPIIRAFAARAPPVLVTN